MKPGWGDVGIRGRVTGGSWEDTPDLEGLKASWAGGNDVAWLAAVGAEVGVSRETSIFDMTSFPREHYLKPLPIQCSYTRHSDRCEMTASLINYAPRSEIQTLDSFRRTQSLAEPMQCANTYLCEMQPRTQNDAFESQSCM